MGLLTPPDFGMVEIVKAKGVEGLEEDLREGTPEVLEGHSTLSYVMFVGSMAIWHVTIITRLLSHRVVAMTPVKVVHQDLGSEAQVAMGEEVNTRFVLGD